MNILREILAWYSIDKGEQYRNERELTDCVDDFLKQRCAEKVVLKCNSLDDVKENIVAILGMIGNPNLKTREDLLEIDSIAMEIYDYLRR
jgi:hypothetical protein